MNVNPNQKTCIHDDSENKQSAYSNAPQAKEVIRLGRFSFSLPWSGQTRVCYLGKKAKKGSMGALDLTTR